jgi:pimeloyl-ACP methyl ester carboxylesterase
MSPRFQACAAIFAAFCGAHAAAQTLEPRAVAYQTDDGLLLSADYYAPPARSAPAPSVVLLHMSNSDRRAWSPLIPPLHEAGLAILAVDLRGHGQSITEETQIRARDRDPLLFADMLRDLRAAYDWLATQPDVDLARFAVIGAETGASLALRYAALDRSVDALVCLSPALNQVDMDSRSDAAKVKGRQLLFVAGRDSDQVQAAETLEKLTVGATVLRRPDSGRGTELLDQSGDVADRIAQFLRRAVGPRSNQVVFGSIQSPIYHEKGSGWIARIRPTNLRLYSSRQEAEARGVRHARSDGPDDGPSSSASAAPPKGVPTTRPKSDAKKP